MKAFNAIFHCSQRSGSISSRAGGFTMIELMVAVVISTILVGILLSVTTGIMTGFQSSKKAIFQGGDIEVALGLLVTDFEGLVIPSMSGSEALRSQPEMVGDANSVALAMLSSVGDRDPSGFNAATRAVAYRLALQNPFDGSATQPRYSLYRSVAPARNTFFNAIGNSDLLDYWDKLPATPSPGPSAITDRGNLIIENVVGFSVRFLRADTGTWTQPDAIVRIGAEGSFVDDVQVEGGIVAVEFTLTLIDARANRLLAEGSIDMDRALREYGYTYMRQAGVLTSVR